MRKQTPYHHILFSLFPVVNFFSTNAASSRGYESQIAIIAAACSAAAAVLAFLLTPILKSYKKAALITFAACFIFFSYGNIVDAVSLHFILPQIKIGTTTLGTNKLFFLFFAAAFLCCALPVVRSRSSLDGATRILNFITAFLLCSSLFFAIYRHPFLLSRKHYSGSGPKASGGTARHTDMPDVYYILLDGYSSKHTFKEWCGFDNSPFEDALEKRGFFIPEEPISNYIETLFSLTSSLNMEYIHQPHKDLRSQSGALQRKLEANKTLFMLKKRGYSYVHIGSGYAITNFNRYADRMVFCGNSNEFFAVFLGTTAFRPLLASAFSKDKRRRAYCISNEMKKIAPGGSPKFVFAHLEIMHPPYVFGPKGEPYVQKTRGWGAPDEYVYQAETMNRMILSIIDEILKNSSSTPIIIMHSDHGPGLVPYTSQELTGKRIREKTGIFTAVLLPQGKGYEDFYPGMTPVNYMRTVFNRQFGASMPLLPDKTYLFLYDKGDFKDVTALANPGAAARMRRSGKK